MDDKIIEQAKNIVKEVSYIANISEYEAMFFCSIKMAEYIQQSIINYIAEAKDVGDFETAAALEDFNQDFF